MIYVECAAYVILWELCVSGLTVKSLIPFEFIVVCGVRRYSRSILLHVAVQLSQHHLLKEAVFSLLCVLALFVKHVILETF